jgi:N-methylhydantoinase A
MRLIGIDTGGTFTDTVIVDGNPGSNTARLGIGKALTTHGNLPEGVIASIGVAAQSLGMTLEECLAGTDILSHGTTVGLNAMLTGKGAKAGLLVTEGFESTLAIARSNKVHGLSDEELTDALKWRKPTLLVPRRLTLGVRERIDVTGSALVPLDEAQARAQIRRLVAEGVEAIGISLLWSAVNGRHEQRLAELVREEAPGVHVTLSSELAARIGEYERTVSVAMNAYVAPLVTKYLSGLDQGLRTRGFRGLFLVMTMAGGVRQVSAVLAAPIHTLQSGPVGGMTASRRLGQMLDQPNVIATDVGGTSFDVGLVVAGGIPTATRPRIDRHGIALPVVDIASIGTGGGSIARVDPGLGVLRVGPQSAGSMPGPACYGRGGTEPTVTDAAVVLGYLDRLGGTLTLDREASVKAVRTRVAEPLGLSVEEAAEGILRVANSQMADLVKRASLQRGHDPRDFILFAYGGAAPQYVGRYAAEIGVKRILIPRLAPEFSAWGAVSSDLRSMNEREIPPRPLQNALEDVNTSLKILEERALNELHGAGEELRKKAGTSIEVHRLLGLRFQRQIHRLDIPVESAQVSVEAARAAEAEFRKRYEAIVGKGSSYTDTAIEVPTVTVEARVPVPSPDFSLTGAKKDLKVVRNRSAWFDGKRVDTPVYLWHDLSEGMKVAGPAFVESEQTTAVIYPGQSAVCDRMGNLFLETGA